MRGHLLYGPAHPEIFLPLHYGPSCAGTVCVAVRLVSSYLQILMVGHRLPDKARHVVRGGVQTPIPAPEHSNRLPGTGGLRTEASGLRTEI